jgi:hypothetical protein
LWDLTGASAGLLSAGSGFTGWKGPYIGRITADPWGKSYFFDPDYYVSNVARVAVGSFGPNKVGPNLYDSDDVYKLLK